MNEDRTEVIKTRTKEKIARGTKKETDAEKKARSTKERDEDEKYQKDMAEALTKHFEWLESSRRSFTTYHDAFKMRCVLICKDESRTRAQMMVIIDELIEAWVENNVTSDGKVAPFSSKALTYKPSKNSKPQPYFRTKDWCAKFDKEYKITDAVIGEIGESVQGNDDDVVSD